MSTLLQNYFIFLLQALASFKASTFNIKAVPVFFMIFILSLFTQRQTVE